MYKGIDIAKHVPLSVLPKDVTMDIVDAHYRCNLHLCTVLQLCYDLIAAMQMLDWIAKQTA